MADYINEKAFEQAIGRELHEQMLKAAEPIVKKALSDAETEMRRKLAAMLVGFVATNYSLERDGRDLVVRVQLGKNEVQK